MDEQNSRHNGDRDPEPGDIPTDGDGENMDACMVWRMAWADLTSADYEAMWRQAADFSSVARELRVIVRGIHPYADCDE